MVMVMASDHLGTQIKKVPEMPQILKSLEIWKRRGNSYLISSTGKIKTRGGKIINQYSNKRGYRFVFLGKTTKFVHTLVANAFLGPNPSRLDVHHIDLSRDNNQIYNLEYLTHKNHCRLHVAIKKG